ncbi:MAG TPA: Hsp20/alpha crystallin family protein [Saprospiraceae bacterium]|nr:Hsp20/alpha crystallin family protein [Saprospiraceae bacterium]MCB9328034.1 Hsp20/alpha crystallin family protein [Lewinellaceae bacterium]HPK08864.1 Hsp20/alpha crystallin family protein [Saprospiraceae bacterium]HPQ20834.1 Hsp20/alpha crystallin family protein [Saprospiraceae bacterium]
MRNSRFYGSPSGMVVAPIFRAWMKELDSNNSTQTKSDSFNPPSNIMSTEDNYVIELAIPGFEKDQINIKIENNVLNVTGNRTQKEYKKIVRNEYDFLTFSRSFNLGKDVDQDSVSAEFVNGILTISLKKKEELKPRTIEINQ